MQPDKPFALFLTWTCYGTWLPGDNRGHVSNKILPGGGHLPKQNTPGTVYAAGDPYTRARAAALQKGSTARLSLTEAFCAAEAMAQAALVRKWRILRAAVMPNHVHVVITDCLDDGSAVQRVLKGTSQAALSRTKGRPQRWWTAAGSARYKHGSEAIEAVVAYLAQQAGVLVEIIDMHVRQAPNPKDF
jgi:REP element-mobilizing transposase RayT